MRRPGALIVHGGLTTGLFNALVAEVLPGPGSVFLHQEWDYPAPAYIGDTVTAEAEVVAARADKPITTLRCVARRQDGTEVLRAAREGGPAHHLTDHAKVAVDRLRRWWSGVRTPVFGLRRLR